MKKLRRFIGSFTVWAVLNGVATGAVLPAGTPVLPADALTAFQLVDDVPPQGRSEVVAVEGQKFGQALLVTTLKQAKQPWLFQLRAATSQPVKKGDVLLATFQARCIQSPAGEAQANFIFEQGRAPFTKSINSPVSAGPEWRQFQFPFVSAGDYPAGQASINFQLGFLPQTIELAVIEVVNYGPSVNVSDLPRTSYDYPGRAADAPWRQAALERIENLRKGPLELTVVDSKGRPLTSAEVTVAMTRQAFAFGSEVGARLLMDKSPDGQKYRDFVVQNFNRVVFGNDLKWGPWEGEGRGRYSQTQTLAAADWLREQGLEIRGHNLVWPSWQNLPRGLAKLKTTPDVLRQRVADHITGEVTALKGRLVEWDVINEPYSEHDLMDVLGNEVMADWFKLARDADAGPRLFINDYNILSEGGLDAAHQEHYEKTIRFLLDHGAPLQGIGLQGHFSSRLTGPERMLEILDRFAKPGLPLEVTEFDVDIADEQLQADFTRDFYIAMFSHPAVTGLLSWGFWEGAHWRPQAAYVRKDWTLKPNGKVWMDLVQKQWKTNVHGKTDAAGKYQVRGFLGEYAITASTGGRSRTVTASLSKEGTTVNIVLE